MRKVMVLLLVVWVAVSVSGCGSINQQLVQASEAYLNATSIEYLEYVNADSKLDADAKKRRVATVDDFQRAITAAKTGK